MKQLEVSIQEHREIARRVRLKTLEIIYKTKSPHIGPSFSIVEVLVSLYFGVINNSPNQTDNEERDRFILSKGHSCASLYAVLFERGFITEEELQKFAVDDGVLEHHPLRNLKQGIELSTGSLGHGLSVGAGLSLAAKMDGSSRKTFVLMGDGEINEGSVWEAAMFASHHKLNNLVAFVDNNKIQALGDTKDILDMRSISGKFSAFGWHVQDVDGHSIEEIMNSMNLLSSNQPNLIVLDTIKGKGVSFMENDLLWHYRPPDEQEYKRALKELG